MTNQRAAWNQASDAYNSLHEDKDTLIHRATQEVTALLGPVAGLDVLEIGCGAGQNCVTLALQGARVTGVDISEAQIALAQDRVERAGVTVCLLRADAANLSHLLDNSFDAIVAVYTFPYVADMRACLAECARLLRPGGRLLLAQDHPIRACYWDEEMQEESVLPARSYFDSAPLHWTFAGTDVSMTSYQRTLDGWFSSLREANFSIETLREIPMPSAWADDPNADVYTRDIARYLPQMVVIDAVKMAGRRHGQVIG